MPLSMLLTKVLSSTGPSTDPWQAPLVMGLHLGIEPLTTSLWLCPSSQSSKWSTFTFMLWHIITFVYPRNVLVFPLPIQQKEIPLISWNKHSTSMNLLPLKLILKQHNFRSGKRINRASKLLVTARVEAAGCSTGYYFASEHWSRIERQVTFSLSRPSFG